MGLVGVNNEPLLERAIFCYDGTDYRVVKCDTDGNLVIALKASQTTEVTQGNANNLKATVTIPTGQDIDARSHGYISGAWQKNPIMRGISGIYEEQLSNTSIGSGTTTINGGTCPAGEYRVITHASMMYYGTSPTKIYASAPGLGTEIVFYDQSSPVSDRWYFQRLDLILQEGDKIKAIVHGGTSGDDVYLRVSGYRIDIDQ